MGLAEIYKALGDESRLRLIHIIAQGFFNVQELTAVLGLSQPTVSHHIKVLQNCGLLRHHKEGTWSYYSLSQETSPSLQVAHMFLEILKSNATNQDTAIFRKDATQVATLLNQRRDQAKNFFDSMAPQWRNIRSEATGIGNLPEDYLFSKIQPHIDPQETLLELGCGSGALLESLLPRAGRTIAVDYSQAMLEEARRTLGQESSKVDLRLGYLEHLPLGDASVDVAVACMVLHHVSDPLSALRDTARVLTSHGKLVLVDLVKHNNEFMRERFNDLWLGFDIDQVSGWMTQAGLNPPHVEYLGDSRAVFLLKTNKREEEHVL